MARLPVTRKNLDAFLRRLGRLYHGHGRLYLVGGSLMVLHGFRAQTEDVDYMVQLEPGGDQDFTVAMRESMRDLNVSAEPAGPADFIPLPRGWQDRSRFLARHGQLDVFAFDPISIALSKIERGADQDIDDALALLRAGYYSLHELQAAFDDVLPRLETESLRVDETDFRLKFEAFVALIQKDRHDAGNLELGT